MSHFKEICRVCEQIISQCRCMSCEKTIKYGICESCSEKSHTIEEVVSQRDANTAPPQTELAKAIAQELYDKCFLAEPKNFKTPDSVYHLIHIVAAVIQPLLSHQSQTVQPTELAIFPLKDNEIGKAIDILSLMLIDSSLNDSQNTDISNALEHLEKMQSLLPSQSVDVEGCVEELADYAHKVWSGWMKHLFSLCKYGSEDGSIAILKDSVDHWHRQIETPYRELSEREKDSDREEARGMIEIFSRHVVPQQTIDIEGLAEKIDEIMINIEMRTIKAVGVERLKVLITKHIVTCQCEELKKELESLRKDWFADVKISEPLSDKISQLQSELKNARDNYKQSRRELGIARSEIERLKNE